MSNISDYLLAYDNYLFILEVILLVYVSRESLFKGALTSSFLTLFSALMVSYFEQSYTLDLLNYIQHPDNKNNKIGNLFYWHFGYAFNGFCLLYVIKQLHNRFDIRLSAISLAVVISTALKSITHLLAYIERWLNGTLIMTYVQSFTVVLANTISTTFVLLSCIYWAYLRYKNIRDYNLKWSL